MLILLIMVAPALHLDIQNLFSFEVYKATQLFCFILAIAPCILFYFLLYIKVQFLIANLFGKAM